MSRFYVLPVRCTKDQDITIEITGTHSITDTSAVITGEVTLKEMGASELLEIGTVISTDQMHWINSDPLHLQQPILLLAHLKYRQ